MPSIPCTRDELTALLGLITAAMADCDVPGAGELDREEWDRLFRYRAAVRDAQRGVNAESANPDTQAMADWLAGEGPNPLTQLGHSLNWQTSLPGEAAEEPCDRAADHGGSLTITAIGPGEMPGVLGGASRPVDEPARADRASEARAPVTSTWMGDILDLAKPAAGTAAPHRPVVPPDRADARRPAPPVRAHAAPDRDRIYIDVPYAENNAAKRGGAICDPMRKSWYAPRPGMAALAPWARLPEVLAGEDRTLGQGLFVDLIPSTSWFANVRSAVSERDWFRIRKMVYRRAGQRCEACGAGADEAADRRLECHERFAYRAAPGAASGVQALRRLICLCSRCHAASHFGLSELRGDRDVILGHLRLVTGMSATAAEQHVDAAFELWHVRSQLAWQVDLSLITDAGIGTARPKGDTAWAS